MKNLNHEAALLSHGVSYELLTGGAEENPREEKR